jgi:hypothetical protein
MAAETVTWPKLEELVTMSDADLIEAINKASDELVAEFGEDYLGPLEIILQEVLDRFAPDANLQYWKRVEADNPRRAEELEGQIEHMTSNAAKRWAAAVEREAA